MSSTNKKPVKQSASTAISETSQVGWGEIAESFEVLGKVGLALAVGMSTAGLFCRLAEQGKVRIPTLSTLVLGGPEKPSNSKS